VVACYFGFSRCDDASVACEGSASASAASLRTTERTVMELSYIIQGVGTNDYDEQDQSTYLSNASDSSSKI